MTSRCLPTYFVSHGGGPWPYMKAESNGLYDQLEASLRAIPGQLPHPPRAVLVVTGHWESPTFALSSSPQPGMIYDYYGFPAHTYQVVYPAPGSPQLAAQVAALLEQAGLGSRLDPERGFDHGTFSVMVTLYPEAVLPVVQLSLRADFDPAAHLAAGRALAPLRDQGVLIVGSGLSYHNLRQFGASGRLASQAFDGWLQQTLLQLPPAARSEQLLNWSKAPAARAAHPREDHLLPLLVAVGAAENESAHCIYQEDFMGAIAVSSYRFG